MTSSTEATTAQIVGVIAIIILCITLILSLLRKQSIQKQHQATKPRAEVGIIKGTKPAQQAPSNIIYPDSQRSHY